MELKRGCGIEFDKGCVEIGVLGKCCGGEEGSVVWGYSGVWKGLRALLGPGEGW